MLARPLLGCSLLLAILASPSLMAEPRYNQVALRAEVSNEIAHDRMHVTLFSEAQDTDPARLANQITRTLNQALETARKTQGVTVATGSRNSYPMYDGERGVITGWRERAELRLESGDFTALSKLTGNLMGSLNMGGMHFSVSNAVRQQNEDAMLKDAVAAFQARAQLATEALGGTDYRLVSLNLNSGGGFQPMLRSTAMKADRLEMLSPEVEAGTQQLTLSADGVIEVTMP
ncbi:SIMPL domain-containing protein [Stutzerimonas tarimensis]|uniref:SIMPL domain-containing protein n=1 Tax=Stutzerimonas tarimensis TaxID=1507735 RepID=A0ABV7T3R8_9GAMM